jgi:hypothetical protein
MRTYTSRPGGPPVAKPTAVALYPDDIDKVERIREHFELDSFSQAMRRAIRITVRSLDADADEHEAEDVA